MKKKTIEKEPFLTLPAVHRGKTVKYAAVTAIRKISGEQHLFIEVYRNRKDSRDIPVVRIAFTKKDFGNYFPESGVWTRGKITENTWSRCGLLWRDKEESVPKSDKTLAEENVLYSAADKKRVRRFLKTPKEWKQAVWNDGTWWEYVAGKQKEIIEEENSARKIRELERRIAALKERQENTGELPEQEILGYADTIIFRNRNIIFYRKHGARATLACSKCGGVTDARWRKGQSYESQFERTVEEPVENHYGICPMCRETGIFVPQGRAGRMRRQESHIFLGQQYKDTGFVLRYVQVEKEWLLEESCGEKGLEMAGAYEKLSGIEIARVYFEPGKKVQKDYHKHNNYTGEDFWDDCNLYGSNNINIGPGKIMPETFEAMEQTFLRYSAMKGYCRAETGEVNPVDYLERYMRTPQIEMLVKMGLTEVVSKLVKCHYGIVQNEDAKTPDTFLGIRKERVKQLIRGKGNTDILKVMQMEKRMGQRWTDIQVEHLAEIGAGNHGSISTALTYMNIQRFLNRVAKYAACEYGTGCSTAVSRLQDTAGRYIDYLEMRHVLGYDMTNTVYLFPRDLDVAHGKMVEESNRKEADARIREASDRYPLIRKHYRQYRRQFYFEDGEFLIRPARDAGEIIMEGKILHHCVGGDKYLSSHNNGNSIILFLRFMDEPEVAYITVEIGTESKNIIQWYGAHDGKPDKERMQKWLDAYVTRLKCGLEAAGQDRAQEAGQGILMPAI